MAKYDKPKILLVDLPSEAAAKLVERGFNASQGTFGKPYKTTRSSDYEDVRPTQKLPNFVEQEIVIADLAMPEFGPRPSQPDPVYGDSAIVVKKSEGYVDPRPLMMAQVESACRQIIEHGGVFIVFAAPREAQEFFTAKRMTASYDTKQRIKCDNWSFLSVLNEENCHVNPEAGNEIKTKSGRPIADLIRKHKANAKFAVTIQCMTHRYEEVAVEATNKYNNPVALSITPLQSTGRLIILPRFEDISLVITDLISQTLPEVVPYLFPHHSGSKWVHLPEYEHPSVKALLKQQSDDMEAAKKRFGEAQLGIDAEGSKFLFLHDLISESGDKLVAAVKRTLEFIGFKEVINADDLYGVEKQEDLQIKDQEPLMLAEIKGLAGLPSQNDTLQIAKYVMRRMKDLKITDVHGVSIINAQRLIPPSERDHKAVFTQAQIGDAENGDFGLMTTYDIFCLVRGMEQWNWPKERVQEVFYGKGRIVPIPSHYKAVGTVTHFYPQASAVQITTTDAISIGDRLGFALGSRFYEEEVVSLKIDNKPVQTAPAGSKAGHQTKLTQKELPLNTVVYRVA